MYVFKKMVLLMVGLQIGSVFGAQKPDTRTVEQLRAALVRENEDKVKEMFVAQEKAIEAARARVRMREIEQENNRLARENERLMAANARLTRYNNRLMAERLNRQPGGTQQQNTVDTRRASNASGVTAPATARHQE